MGLSLKIGLDIGSKNGSIVPFKSDLTERYSSVEFDTYTPNEYTINELTNIYWYKQPDIYVDDVYQNKVLAFRKGEVMLSVDNGATYKYRAKWEGKDRLESSHIFGNGNIMLATCNAIFYSDDNLATIKQASVKGLDGDDYSVPVQIANNFFMRNIARCTIDGVELAVGTNYGNVNDGNSPTNVFYTRDYGLTWKIAYQWGQHANYGNLGNPDNPEITRHGHGMYFNSDDNSIWGDFGDDIYGGKFECHWLKCSYNTSLDLWTCSIIASGDAGDMFKSSGMGFNGDEFYFGSDITGDVTKRMIYKGDYTDPANTSLFTKIYNSANVVSNMEYHKEDSVIIAGEGSTNNIITSKNNGQTFVSDTITDAAFPTDSVSFTRFSEKRTDGWIKANHTGGGILYRMNRFVWIKLK